MHIYTRVHKVLTANFNGHDSVSELPYSLQLRCIISKVKQVQLRYIFCGKREVTCNSTLKENRKEKRMKNITTLATKNKPVTDAIKTTVHEEI
ncbi:hypothetical protein PUN28_004210 [Cardiocondyla obscurior]|uniref:Uncharacterized protein n=1 Tax=Cardiocondyla obscurior TaxID=286306 RepID=A0AAW2GQ21_9HYME